jgi:hypothetical protein
MPIEVEEKLFVHVRPAEGKEEPGEGVGMTKEHMFQIMCTLIPVLCTCALLLYA